MSGAMTGLVIPCVWLGLKANTMLFARLSAPVMRFQMLHADISDSESRLELWS